MVNGDRSQKVTAILVGGATAEIASELNKNIPPDPGWVRGQEKKAKEALDGAQAEVAKAIDKYMPDGSGDNKGGELKGGGLGKVLGGAAVISGIIQEASNPNPSKDAHEAHKDNLEQKQKKQELEEKNKLTHK